LPNRARLPKYAQPFTLRLQCSIRSLSSLCRLARLRCSIVLPPFLVTQPGIGRILSVCDTFGHRVLLIVIVAMLVYKLVMTGSQIRVSGTSTSSFVPFPLSFVTFSPSPPAFLYTRVKPFFHAAGCIPLCPPCFTTALHTIEQIFFLFWLYVPLSESLGCTVCGNPILTDVVRQSSTLLRTLC